MNKILEAQKKEFMSKKEQKLKKRLIELLRDDGKGHRYPKFAKRLEAFDVNIVYLSDDKNFTAAISFDEGKIYISEGFLQNEELFYQLNVLMRHELAHNLMMHQIRMLNKFNFFIFAKSPILSASFFLYTAAAPLQATSPRNT